MDELVPEAIRLMPILSDLTKETSFRRFYLRWLAACCLPVVAVAALWAGAWTVGSPASLRILRFVSSIEMWALVGVGQWWFMRRYSKLAGWFAILTFIGGMIATLIWLTTTRTMLPVPMGVVSSFALYLSQFVYGLKLSPFIAVAGTFFFGFSIAACQAPLMTQNRGDRRMWIMTNGWIAFIILVSAYPYALDRLTALRSDVTRLDDFMESPLFVPAVILTSMPTPLLAVWSMYAVGAGLFLWVMRRRQAWREGEVVARVFD